MIMPVEEVTMFPKACLRLIFLSRKQAQWVTGVSLPNYALALNAWSEGEG